MNSDNKAIKEFIEKLAKYPEEAQVNNFYHPSKMGAEVRRENLKTYLEFMLKKKPKLAMIGEAPGYNGCAKTGIPFTSEDVLQNFEFFEDKGYKFENKNSSKLKEPSATIVWNELKNYKNLPLIWNIFPFHPYKEKKGKNSNRPPRAAELKAGTDLLNELLAIFNINKVIAVGRKAESRLNSFPHTYVRHPANGGKTEFQSGLKKAMEGLRD